MHGVSEAALGSQLEGHDNSFHAVVSSDLILQIFNLHLGY